MILSLRGRMNGHRNDSPRPAVAPKQRDGMSRPSVRFDGMIGA
jgi:hypothetical protein